MVEFTNGSRYNLPAEFLRVFSPAVDSKIRSIGGEKVLLILIIFWLRIVHDMPAFQANY